MRLGMLRIDRQRTLLGFQRLLVAAERQLRDAPVAMRVDKIRPGGDGFFVGGNRFRVAAERRQHDAAVVMCLGEFRLQLDRLLEARERLFGTREGFKGKALIVQNCGGRFTRTQGGRDELQRLGRLAFGELDPPIICKASTWWGRAAST